MKRIKESKQSINILLTIMNKKLLTTADCNNVSYRSPEVSVTEIFAEGVLCASKVGSELSVEAWEDGDFSW